MYEYKALNNMAYERLRQMIYDRELEFNTLYSEAKIAAQLSVSRTPVRDALSRLSRERYIEILPNRGFMLHKPNEADVIEAYHVRMMIEVYCAQIIARRFPDESSRRVISRMEDALEKQRMLIENGDTYSLNQFWYDDIDFHKALLDYLNLSSFNLQYDSLMHIFMPHHLLCDDTPAESCERVLARHNSTLVEHTAIIEAMKSRDPEAVREAIRRHLKSSTGALSIYIDD